MTKVKTLLILLADGVPRSKADIAEALGLSIKDTHTTIQTALKTATIESHVTPVFYAITEAGAAESTRQPVKKETLARKRREAAIREAAKAERKKRDEEITLQAHSITYRATSGKIANSVFNWR